MKILITGAKGFVGKNLIAQLNNIKEGKSGIDFIKNIDTENFEVKIAAEVKDYNPEELIGAALFLASDETASFVNGIVLPVDGGYSAYSGV